jgi:hypothetical protein
MAVFYHGSRGDQKYPLQSVNHTAVRSMTARTTMQNRVRPALSSCPTWPVVILALIPCQGLSRKVSAVENNTQGRREIVSGTAHTLSESRK